MLIFRGTVGDGIHSTDRREVTVRYPGLHSCTVADTEMGGSRYPHVHNFHVGLCAIMLDPGGSIALRLSKVTPR